MKKSRKNKKKSQERMKKEFKNNQDIINKIQKRNKKAYKNY